MDVATRASLIALAAVLAVTRPLLLPLLVLPVLALRRTGRRADASRHQALHDVLTGLPNRALFADRVDRALASALRDGARPVVMLLDLDGFKGVNDALGHHNGDELLRQIGPRIAGVLRSSDTVARLGGDEFGVLVPGLRHVEAERIVRRLTAANPGLSAAAGIAEWDGQESAAQLVHRADAAMYVDKRGR